jgi:hypothetical protein
MEKKILYINREVFIDWFLDEDMIETFVHDQGVIKELIDTGTFTITAEELLSGAGYLPSHLASKGQEVVLNEMDEIDTDHYDEIKFK